MEENEMRELVREEIANYFLQNPLKAAPTNVRTQADKSVQIRHIQLLDGRNIQTGQSNGTTIATTATQKLSVYGVVPIIQQSAISGPSGSGTAGVDTPARTAINSLIASMKAFGITK